MHHKHVDGLTPTDVSISYAGGFLLVPSYSIILANGNDDIA